MCDGKEDPSRLGPEWCEKSPGVVLSQQLIRSEGKLTLPPLIYQPCIGSNPKWWTPFVVMRSWQPPDESFRRLEIACLGLPSSAPLCVLCMALIFGEGRLTGVTSPRTQTRYYHPPSGGGLDRQFGIFFPCFRCFFVRLFSSHPTTTRY